MIICFLQSPGMVPWVQMEENKDVNHCTVAPPPILRSSAEMLSIPGAFPLFICEIAVETSSSENGAHRSESLTFSGLYLHATTGRMSRTASLTTESQLTTSLKCSAHLLNLPSSLVMGELSFARRGVTTGLGGGAPSLRIHPDPAVQQTTLSSLPLLHAHSTRHSWPFLQQSW